MGNFKPITHEYHELIAQIDQIKAMQTTIEKPIDKLPKWAQMMLRDAERRASNAETALKDYLDSESEGPVYTRSGLSEKRYIQDDRVSFQLTNGEITVALKGQTLECHASYRGGTRLLVIPYAQKWIVGTHTNVVHLEIQKEP